MICVAFPQTLKQKKVVNLHYHHRGQFFSTQWGQILYEVASEVLYANNFSTSFFQNIQFWIHEIKLSREIQN